MTRGVDGFAWANERAAVQTFENESWRTEFRIMEEDGKFSIAIMTTRPDGSDPTLSRSAFCFRTLYAARKFVERYAIEDSDDLYKEAFVPGYPEWNPQRPGEIAWMLARTPEAIGWIPREDF